MVERAVGVIDLSVVQLTSPPPPPGLPPPLPPDLLSESDLPELPPPLLALPD